MALDLDNPEVKSEIDKLLNEKLTEQKQHLESEFNSAIAERINGIEKKNKELLSEKKAEQARARAYAEAVKNKPPEEVAEMYAEIEKNQLEQHLKKGEMDAYNSRIVERDRAQAEAVINELKSKYETVEQQAEKYKSRVEELTISQSLKDEFIAAKGKTDKAAQKYMLVAAQEIWKINEDGVEEARDPETGELLKGKTGLLTKSEWIQDYLKVESPFLFDGVSGSGATGGSSKLAHKSKDKMSDDERVAFIIEHGSEAYAALPDEVNKR